MLAQIDQLARIPGDAPARRFVEEAAERMAKPGCRAADLVQQIFPWIYILKKIAVQERKRIGNMIGTIRTLHEPPAAAVAGENHARYGKGGVGSGDMLQAGDLQIDDVRVLARIDDLQDDA